MPVRSDRVIAIVLLLLFAVYASQIGLIELDIWAADSFLTARTLPIVLAAGGALLALLLLIWPESSHRMKRLSAGQVRRLAALALALIAFAAAVTLLGLWIACALFLLVTQLIEGERRPQALVGLALGAPLGLWLLVEKGLQQHVAVGTLF